MQRHQELCRCSIQATSLSHTMECNRATEKQHFDLLTSLIGKCIFTPGNIYNGTQTGISTVHNTPIKVFGFRGKSQVEGLSSAEMGTLVTSEICMNASGNFKPTLYVFPRARRA